MAARWPIASWRTIVAYDIAVVLKWPRRFPRIRVRCCECASISTSEPSPGKDAAVAGGYPEAWLTILRRWWVMTFLRRRDRTLREIAGHGEVTDCRRRLPRIAAAATRDYYFRPFKSSLVSANNFTRTNFASVRAYVAYVHPASDKCANLRKRAGRSSMSALLLDVTRWQRLSPVPDDVTDNNDVMVPDLP